MRPVVSSTQQKRVQAQACTQFWKYAVGAVALGAAFLGLMWLGVAAGMHQSHPWVVWSAGAVVLMGLGWLGFRLIGLAMAVRGRGNPRYWRGVLRGFLPVVEVLARLDGKRRAHSRRPALSQPSDSSEQAESRLKDVPSPLEQVRWAFIFYNNALVERQAPRCTPDKLLVLLPHCLQASHCPLRLTHAIDNCRRCGRCTLRDFLALRDELGVKLAVAPGGTIARRIVRRDRPEVVVAVACERDLAAGIQDTAPLPVYGVLNERPDGPCIDTTVSIARVNAAILLFIK